MASPTGEESRKKVQRSINFSHSHISTILEITNAAFKCVNSIFVNYLIFEIKYILKQINYIEDVPKT